MSTAQERPGNPKPDTGLPELRHSKWDWLLLALVVAALLLGDRFLARMQSADTRADNLRPVSLRLARGQHVGSATVPGTPAQ